MENHIKVQFRGIQDHKRLKQKLIDKMANKKVITKNSASRQKSRLNKNIKLIS